jgi:4a-hydroxytetrahydrobiopterin dehydratase
MDLKDKKCIPCNGATPALDQIQKEKYLSNINPSWVFSHQNTRLSIEVKLRNFKEAFNLTEKIFHLAESQNHHPDLHLAWGKLGIEIWTHKINDLVESDFILAAKIDELLIDYLPPQN